MFVAKRTCREDTYDRHLDLGIVFGRMRQGPYQSGAARYGILAGDIGYAHVSHWEDPIPDLDRVVGMLRDRRAVIIDLRHNPGGDFRNGFAFAARFADARRLAFTTRTKTGPGRGELGQRVDWYVEPSGPQRIGAPVVVLTKGYTNSAAERTLLGLAVLPNVTLIGAPTAGDLGEKVGGELSNGWRYSLVPQVVEDASGRSWAGPGIPPDVRVDNAEEEIAAGIDRQLDAALVLLGAAPELRRTRSALRVTSLP